MDETMAGIVAWLDGLDSAKVRAYACQRGLTSWKTASGELLRRELAALMYAQETQETAEAVE
jgi:hypothetical protein